MPKLGKKLQSDITLLKRKQKTLSTLMRNLLFTHVTISAIINILRKKHTIRLPIDVSNLVKYYSKTVHFRWMFEFY